MFSNFLTPLFSLLFSLATILASCGGQEISSSRNFDAATSGNSDSASQTINNPLNLVNDCIYTSGGCPAVYASPTPLTSSATVTAHIKVLFDQMPWTLAQFVPPDSSLYECYVEVCNSGANCTATSMTRDVSHQYWIPGAKVSTILNVSNNSAVLNPVAMGGGGSYIRAKCDLHWMLVSYAPSRPIVLNFQIQ